MAIEILIKVMHCIDMLLFILHIIQLFQFFILLFVGHSHYFFIKTYYRLKYKCLTKFI